MSKTVTYGAFIIYANGIFEAERKTRRAADRLAIRIERAGLTPTMKRHATDGTWSWNEEVA